jgi:hypothetical protein
MVKGISVKKHRVMVSLPLPLYALFHRWARRVGFSDDKAGVMVFEGCPYFNFKQRGAACLKKERLSK